MYARRLETEMQTACCPASRSRPHGAKRAAGHAQNDLIRNEVARSERASFRNTSGGGRAEHELDGLRGVPFRDGPGRFGLGLRPGRRREARQCVLWGAQNGCRQRRMHATGEQTPRRTSSLRSPSPGRSGHGAARSRDWRLLGSGPGPAIPPRATSGVLVDRGRSRAFTEQLTEAPTVHPPRTQAPRTQPGT